MERANPKHGNSVVMLDFQTPPQKVAVYKIFQSELPSFGSE
jgi:hypothetical protein